MRSIFQSLLLTFTTISINNAGTQYPDITSDDIEKLRIDIREAIDASTLVPNNPFNLNFKQPLIASIIRLVFHDCVGRNIKQNNGNGADSPSGQLTDNRCNGCIDLTEPDNQPLEQKAIDPLEEVYQGDTNDNDWYLKMSRVDFWMASATIALEIAAENQYLEPGIAAFPNSPPMPLRDIAFYFGREDCPRSPEATEKDVFEFPSANVGWDKTFAFFEENLQLTERETVAILGGHTLGQVRPKTSGFVNQWVTFANILNNEFHFNLVTAPINFLALTGYEQRRVGDLKTCINSCNPVTSNNRQWVIGPDAGYIDLGIFTNESIGFAINLNSDISMAIKIVDHLDEDTGIVTCNAPTYTDFLGIPGPNRCPLQDAQTADGVLIRDIVNEYGNDNEVFMNDFADVFEKMILTGEKLHKLQKLTVPYDRSFEDADSSMISPAMNQMEVNDDTGYQQVEDSQTGSESMYYWLIGGGILIVLMLSMVIIFRVYRRRKLMKSLKAMEESNDYGTSQQN